MHPANMLHQSTLDTLASGNAHTEVKVACGEPAFYGNTIGPPKEMLLMIREYL